MRLTLDDAALLIACARRRPRARGLRPRHLPWHAGQVIRAGHDHGGLVLYRRTVASTDYGQQARLLTDFWVNEAHAWDWLTRIVYLPKSPPPQRR